MKEIVIATKNKHKIIEMKKMLEPLGYKVLTLFDFEEFPEIIEDGITFRENALKKAKELSDYLHKTVVADDSGLEVFSLRNRIEYTRKVFGWEVTQQMSGNFGVRMKFWTTYLLVTATFVLFALELLVRLLNLAPPLPKQYGNFVNDTYLPYKPRPSSTISGRTDEFDFEYKHNSLGFRDVEHTLAKPEGVFYILGLGDSFTYGVGISFEESYLFRLEKMLNERQGEHPKIEIIKAGIPRFFPEAERLVLQHYGIKFNPDLILIGFLVNDVMDTFSRSRYQIPS